MSATDELRRMLDEHGVEWMDDSYAQLWCTVWHGQDGKQWRMTENQSGMLTELKAWKATPAQAIAATLGAVKLEKAKAKRMPNMWGFSSYYCGCCGHKLAEVANGLNEHFPNYCESCGTKAVYE